MPKKLADWSPADIALAAEQAACEARANFWAFRRYIRPNMLWGWWVEKVSIELQMFYGDIVAGKRPTLVLMTPPQHGKTTAAEDFTAWLAGRHPDWKTIYASYSDELGVQRNLNLQRIIQSRRYRSIFNTRIGSPGFQMNSSVIEYVGHTGSFMNTTVGGSITGLGLNPGVLDDPVTGETAIGLVVRGDARKLAHFRRSGRAATTFHHGWEWASVEGPVRIDGPDDPIAGLASEAIPGLLRDVFRAAGGTHDDWDEYDRVMAGERRTAVLIHPARFVTNS